jgi:hypothetical protein
MHVRCRRATVLAIAAGAAIVVTTGTASAYWSTSGTGQGAARTANPWWLTVDPGTTSAALAPGGTADVSFVIGNPTEAPMLVTSVLTPPGGIPGFSDPSLVQLVGSCDAAHSGVSVVRGTARPTSFVIAPHGWYTLTLANAVTMNGNSDSSCQGLFFAVPIKVQAQSVVGSAATVPAASTL